MKTTRPAKATRRQGRPDIFVAASVVDNAKDKAKRLSEEAQKEFDKASHKAQAKAGNIDLYSPKYYAACTVGGILACVCAAVTLTRL